MKDNLFLLDIPEEEKNDAIGYDIYVNKLIDAINSDAKMIGLISNYGSGKSTIINMVRRRTEVNNIKFVMVNLWKIKEKPKNTKNSNVEDETIEIHKNLLQKLILELPSSANKEHYKRKVDNKYSLFNISMKNKSDIFSLYMLFAVFLFNVIQKLEIVNFEVPRVCNFIIDLAVAIGFVYILSRSKLYLSFNKDSTRRQIDENDTIECFNDIITEYKKEEKEIKNIVICIEDLDRYNDSDFVIRVLEQIYKFYSENNLNVKFIISLKPPYLLAKDSNKINIVRAEEDNNSIIKVDDNVVREYKELYEKLFDLIINLQTVAIQNYSSVLLGLISPKEEYLKSIGIVIPKKEEDIGVWNYLYMGENVSIRDIKHRFNYFLILYENLNNHKKTLDNPELININIETCLFVSYLEDEYSTDFYELINNSIRFNYIVSEFLLNKSFSLLSENNNFDNELKNALVKGIINLDYSMYFYKYPKKKPINNIYDNAIQNAIFRNSKDNIINFDEYCEKASKDIVVKSLKQKCGSYGIPEIIFENRILYKEAELMFRDKILQHLQSNYVFSAENGSKQVSKMLKKILLLENEKLLSEYLGILYEDLNSNYTAEQIAIYRYEIIKLIGFNSKVFSLFDRDMPLITQKEIKEAKSSEEIFQCIYPEQINESIYDVIEFIINNFSIKIDTIINFLDKISNINETMFKKIFYMFNFEKFSKSKKVKLFDKSYKALSLDDFNELKVFVKHVGVLTIAKEKEIIKKLSSSTENEKKDIEQIYIDIIKSVNHLSSVTKKYIPNLSYYYIYTEEIEEQLFNMEFYIEYCYSKFDRLEHMIYEENKFEILKPYYVKYFMNNKNINNKYKFDLKVLKHVKDNISYKDINIEKIKILTALPQKVEDFQVVYNKKYKIDNPSSTSLDLRSYLRSLKKIEETEENKFVDVISEEVKSNKLKLSITSYKHISRLLTLSNIRRFQRIKKYCQMD